MAIIFSILIYLSVQALAALQSGSYQADPIANAIRLLGLTLFLTGFAMRMLARQTLGKYFSTKLRVLEDHEIVINGIYRYIRHPAYLGLLYIFLAIPLLFYSLYGFILILLGIPDVHYRIRREEGYAYRTIRKCIQRVLENYEKTASVYILKAYFVVEC